jgi:hypothetical protein
MEGVIVTMCGVVAMYGDTVIISDRGGHTVVGAVGGVAVVCRV